MSTFEMVPKPRSPPKPPPDDQTLHCHAESLIEAVYFGQPFAHRALIQNRPGPFELVQRAREALVQREDEPFHPGLERWTWQLEQISELAKGLLEST